MSKQRCDNNCQGGECGGSSTLHTWKGQCPAPKAWRPPKPNCSMVDNYNKLRNAVVRISTQTGITQSVTTGASIAAGGTTLLTPYLALPEQSTVNSVDQYFTFGNGFFICGHRIVVPAHLVLLPPNITQAYGRYNSPLVPDSLDFSTFTFNGSVYYQVGRILVDVFDVNGFGSSYTYEANLIGVSGADDVAVLEISCNASIFTFNSGALEIDKCHPVLKFGTSVQYRTAEPVFLMGDLVTRNFTGSLNQGGINGGLQQTAVRGYVEGTVYNYQFVDPVGLAQPELLVVSVPGVYATSAGAPILNKYGKVIAIQTMSVPGIIAPESELSEDSSATLPTPLSYLPLGEGLVGGPSQRAIYNPIRNLVRAADGEDIRTLNISIYRDPLYGSTPPKRQFFVVEKPYLGVAWELFTGIGYGSAQDPATGITYGIYSPVTGNYNQADPNVGSKREVVGVRIKALAGDDATTPGYPVVENIFVPGATTTGTTNFVDSPLLLTPGDLQYQAKPNDVIAMINGARIGGTTNLTAITNALWLLCPGDIVDVGIRTATPGTSIIPETLFLSDFDVVVRVVLQVMPHAVNYPWYKYQSLPLNSPFRNLVSPPFFSRYSTPLMQNGPLASDRAHFFPSA